MAVLRLGNTRYVVWISIQKSDREIARTGTKGREPGCPGGLTRVPARADRY